MALPSPEARVPVGIRMLFRQRRHFAMDATLIILYYIGSQRAGRLFPFKGRGKSQFPGSTVSRKPISRKLPTLDSLFPRFRGVGKGDHGVEKATAQMQRAARLLRRNMNQSFYSMREAAGFCAVTVSTMGLVYQRLEDEGLVQRIRGSRTVLLGKAARSRYRTRRIVSVPLQLSSLVSSHFTRRFCERINEELCK